VIEAHAQAGESRAGWISSSIARDVERGSITHGPANWPVILWGVAADVDGQAAAQGRVGSKSKVAVPSTKSGTMFQNHAGRAGAV
jgi:hypothetical protein